MTCTARFGCFQFWRRCDNTFTAPAAATVVRCTACGRLVEYWNCVIDGYLQQGIDDFKLDGNGRVTDQTAWLRPWPVVTVLRDRAIASRPPFLPADYWLLRAEPSHLS
jgi:hypothetical protein